MNKITLFILCSSIIAVSKANLIDNVTAQIAAVVSDAKVIDMAKTLSALANLQDCPFTDGPFCPFGDISNCLSQYQNMNFRETCDRCDVGYIRICRKSGDNEECGCTISTTPNCQKEDYNYGAKPFCKECAQGYKLYCSVSSGEKQCVCIAEAASD